MPTTYLHDAPMDFLTGTWGRVTVPPPGEPHLIAVRIDPERGGSWTIVVRDPDGTFDTWVETRQDVLDYLATLTVEWSTP